MPMQVGLKATDGSIATILS